MKDQSAVPGAVPEPLQASGPSVNPNANILAKCAGVCASAGAVIVVLALIFANGAAVASVVLGSLIVMAFFGLSLVVGHFVAKRRPGAVMGAFFMTYIVKVVGFGVVLFTWGTPQWLVTPWFMAAAVTTVLLWQATEVIVFSRNRYLLFGDAPQAPVAPDARKDDGL
ncbi:hypothetical protein [Arthrobacter cryoconiti]|uniref:ATP synthase protein I n=1 Tax=Arthrobacter cryoconiti TaxID=748907 RepID=A0ABV8QXG0_9MICC|nr:hypothetical protein [Arthrobacter cryoconiti]MCC9068933.1 hypothetical protein [Arthrobacter cryoconiti]